MKKRLTIIILFLIASCSAYLYFWPNLKMRFADNAQYTESETREYNYYTPDILKNMPRISPEYDFSYTNISGPQAQVWSVTFHNAQDSGKINKYLSQAGYEQQNKCDVEAICWRIKNSEEILTIVKMKSSNAVRVDILKSRYEDKYTQNK